jgi:thiamine-phosphate pyrophosphorylase
MAEQEAAWRVLDANLNRAAEGLRTLEDVARLVWEDSTSSLQLKNLRHSLAAAAQMLPRAELLAARSVESDAGTAHTTPRESDRTHISSIVAAASERVAQSLRCCEEFSKVIDVEAAERFKQLRYLAYEQLAAIELRLSHRRWLQDARLCVLVNAQRPLHEFLQYIAQLAQAGATCIQLREKSLPDAQLLLLASEAVRTLAEYGCHLVVNDRLDIALASGASGVHLGQDDLPLTAARKLAGHQLCIGVSTHSVQQALVAEQEGADYIGCGPTFPSETKSFTSFAGVPLLTQIASKIQIPAFAIGGITTSNLQRVRGAGIARVAVSAAVHSASDPCVAVAEFTRLLA